MTSKGHFEINWTAEDFQLRIILDEKMPIYLLSLSKSQSFLLKKIGKKKLDIDEKIPET